MLWMLIVKSWFWCEMTVMLQFMMWMLIVILWCWSNRVVTNHDVIVTLLLLTVTCDFSNCMTHVTPFFARDSCHSPPTWWMWLTRNKWLTNEILVEQFIIFFHYFSCSLFFSIISVANYSSFYQILACIVCN